MKEGLWVAALRHAVIGTEEMVIRCSQKTWSEAVCTGSVATCFSWFQLSKHGIHVSMSSNLHSISHPILHALPPVPATLRGSACSGAPNPGGFVATGALSMEWEAFGASDSVQPGSSLRHIPRSFQVLVGLEYTRIYMSYRLV